MEDSNILEISDSLATIVSFNLHQPLDVIKTRLQVDRRGHYKGIKHCGVTTAKSEGIRALWKGSIPALTWNVLYSTGQITSGAFSHTNIMWAEPLVGCLCTPFELVRTRLIMQQQSSHHNNNVKYKGALHCVRTIIREERIRGLWAGLAPISIRNGIEFAAVQGLQAVDMKKIKNEENNNINIIRQLLVTATVLLLTPCLTTPLDVVATRLMAQGGSNKVNKYKGMIHAFKTIYSEEGLFVFWRSNLLRIISLPSVILVSVPLTYKTYDTIKDTQVKWKLH